MEKCFVDSVCPPLRIQQAAVEIGHWFADNNIKHWELAYCASRDSFEQLRQRVVELEAALMVAKAALNDCEGALDECRDYPITYDTILEALAKINEVLHD